MKLDDAKYNQFGLVADMLETCQVMEEFSCPEAEKASKRIEELKDVFFTGEGSSHIFPAKSTIFDLAKTHTDIKFATEGSYQGLARDLSDTVVLGASNSGRTKELMVLAQELAKTKRENFFSVTANPTSPLIELSSKCYVLNCGQEKAIAATKSVVEQSMVFHEIMANTAQYSKAFADFKQNKKVAAETAKQLLTMDIDPEITEALAKAPMIYFAGLNNGVAEELTLKTNEIARKKSDYLEGTYALHGIEEVMTKDDCIIFIEPFTTEFKMMKTNFEEKIGVKVIAVTSEKETPFKTIHVPTVKGYETFMSLFVGWNLLVEVGIALGVNLDKPQRARKIGNILE